MKIAVSSAAFSAAFSQGRSTQLEWLDACANELEVDGVVFDLDDFPRTDDEYLAQLKKSAADLGLTIAAIAGTRALEMDYSFAIARALGAPIVIANAPPAAADPGAWSAFVVLAKARAREAKAANVVLALRNLAGTLCPGVAELRRIAYDVDGSWLRFALDPLGTATDDESQAALAKSVIVASTIGDAASFARAGDERATRLIAGLARFRGFVVLESDDALLASGAYHAAIERFAGLRAAVLDR